VKVYNLMDHDPLDTLTRGKAVLIGDAAHPMLPTHAQGGGFSLEDAATLEVLFQGVTDPQEVPKRLQLFQYVRLSRCSVTQIMSNNIVRSPEKLEEDVRKYYNGALPPANTAPFAEAYRDFFWPYNVFEESSKALRGLEPKPF
jgi:salicylate hydroxylase